MIIPRSSSDRRALFCPTFFRGVMRRAWPKLLCYSLFLFFVLPLPILFSINERRNRTTVAMLEMLDRMLTDNLWIYCLAATALGVFAGILATRYLTRRASVDYYHSLPLRREGLLIAHWLEGALHFASAIGINLILSLIVIGTVAKLNSGFGAIVGKLVLDVAYMLMVFLLFYTLTVFCGMLCGTSVMQVMVTGLSLGAYPMLRLLLIAFGEALVSRMDIYAMTERNWRFTSPLLRLFYLSGTDALGYPERFVYIWEEPFLWWEILLWITATVALFFAALALYRRRHVERAGTPVVFGGMAAAVRWVVVLLGTMGLGWLFQALGNGDIFWLFFGFLLGGFLSFILVGTLLTKNPKQMFEGWRRLIVYLVLFCLLFVGFAWAVSAIDQWTPKHVDRISLYFDGDNYCVPYYEDPAVITAWQELEKNAAIQAGKTPDERPFGTEEYYAKQGVSNTHFYFDERYVSLKAQVKVGPFVIPYLGQSYLRVEMKDLLRAVADSDELEAGWDLRMAELRQDGLTDHDPLKPTSMQLEVAMPAIAGELSMYRFFADAYAAKVGGSVDRMESSMYNKYYILGPVTDETDEIVFGDFDDVGFELFQSPVYAMVTDPEIDRVEATLLGDSPYRNTFYLYLHMSTPSYYREVMGMDEDAFYEAMADTILATEYGGLYVAKRVHDSFSLDDDHVMKITDRAQLIEVLRGMSILAYDQGSRPISVFTVYDEGYGIVFPNGGSSEVTYFIDGKVPAFVRETLG